MAILKQCKVCEKKGVFLKLHKGLCEECTDELKFLEKQYSEIDALVNGSLNIDDPEDIIAKANLILSNIDKFQNAYTPMRKATCLEAISLMKNLIIYEDFGAETEPLIYVYPETKEDDNINSLEITLNKLSDNITAEEKTDNNIQNIDIKSYTNLETTDEILEENLNLKSSTSDNDNSFAMPESIILDTGKIQNITINPLKHENSTHITSEPKNEENSFENITFDEKLTLEDSLIKENTTLEDTPLKEISKDKDGKNNITHLDELKKLLDNIEKTLANSNFDSSTPKSTSIKTPLKINEQNIELANKNETNYNINSTEINSISEDTLNNNEEDSYPIEETSIKDLAKDIIFNFKNNLFSPEEKGYNLEVLKNYASMLSEEKIYIIDNINLEEFIVDNEKKLLKSLKKSYRDLFDFFNYVSFSLVKEEENIYTLSAVKICYGKIIDTFYSKYSIDSSNIELESLGDVVLKFTKFIDNMLLVTHNANFTISNLKSSFSIANKFTLKNKFICTRNSYLKLCSKLNISRQNTVDIYVCLRHFFSNEELEELNEEASINLIDAIKTFKLYEKLKYLI